tara:strand:+ start:4450 stop:6423 length:1974 start_codon:yes stop_codon:yes gene_type:complete
MSNALEELRKKKANANLPRIEPTTEAAPQGSYAGNLLRTAVGQGFGLGFGDEIEGAINSGLSQLSDDPKTYQQARGIARAKIKQFQSENPGVGITSEIVGGLIPTVIAMMTGVGAPAGVANAVRLGNLGGRLLTAGKVGTAAGTGYSEQGLTDNPLGLAYDAGKGAVAAMAGGEILRGAARGAGSLYDKGVNAIRNKYGDGYAGKVQEYLNDLMKRTGKSLDETLEDIRNGAVMSEDEQLLASLRLIASKGGDASGDIKNAAKIRAEQTRGSAKEALDEALVPGQSGQNVRRVLKSTDEELKADQAAQYESIYAQSKAIPKRLSDRIVGMMRVNPQVRKMFVEDFESARLANPRYQQLFKMVKNEDGTETLELLRPITLADAEGFRRNLKETASMIFESPNKRNTPGFNYNKAEIAVRSDIDKFSPDLAAVRGSFADREAVEAAIRLGRQMSSKSSDEVGVAMDTLTSPEQLAGFRAGMHNAVNKKFSDSGGLWSARAGGLDVSNRTPNALMKEILPEDQADDVIERLGRYGMANQVNQKVKPAGGAITQFAEAAGNELDAVGTAGVGVQLARGDLPGAALSLMNKLRPKDLGLNDKQLQSVVKVLFSEDPEFVRRALADNTTVGELNKRIIRIAQNMEIGGQNIVRRQSPGILEDF